MTLISIADVAKFLSDVIAKVEAKYKKRRQQRDEKRNRGEVKRNKKRDSGEESAEEEKRAEDNEDEEDDLLAEPGPWSKSFVLFLLLAYMSLSALACSVFKEAWNYTDSFYFCLITMVDDEF